MSLVEPLTAFVLIGAILLLRQEILKRREAKIPKAFSYRVRDDFLSPAELAFFESLCKATRGWLVVCPKVAMQDIFFPASGSDKERFIQRNMINRRHTDFLLCNPQNMKPVAGIELDDKSHKSEKAKAVDELKNKVYHAAKLPLIRIEAKKTYNIGNLKKTIAKAIHGKNAPVCDKCNIPLVLRVSKKESLFWGCINFPQCREIKPFNKIKCTRSATASG